MIKDAKKPSRGVKDKGPKAEREKRTTSKAQWCALVFKVVLLLVWVASSVIVAQLVVGYLMLWMLGRETFVQTVPTAIYSALSYILALAWILFITPKIVARLKIANEHTKKEHRTNGKIVPETMSREDLGLKGLPTWTDVGLAPVGFVVATLLAFGLVAIFKNFAWFDAEQAQEVGFSVYTVGFERLVAFVILVLVAPVAEELIFRGWLYGKLRPMLSEKMSDTTSMIISIFLVSLLFGVIHMQWNVGVNVFALSVVLCGLREITGTIYSGIVVHMIKNGLAFWLLYVVGIR